MGHVSGPWYVLLTGRMVFSERVAPLSSETVCADVRDVTTGRVGRGIVHGSLGNPEAPTGPGKRARARLAEGKQVENPVQIEKFLLKKGDLVQLRVGLCR